MAMAYLNPVHRGVGQRRRARWMGPAMLVLAGMAAAAPAGADMVEIPEWQRVLAAHGVTGTVVVRRLGEQRSFASDVDGAERGLTPASTFKIPHLLIALETGVVRDVEQVHPPDRRTQRIAGSNADESVGRAVEASSAPVFQAIARSIGEERMGAWLARLGYGNPDLSGRVDRFWLDGSLEVTPTQQVDFVERLLLGTLPASTRSQIAARDAVPGEDLGCGTVLRGKTGWAHGNGEDGPDVGWLVGWVERPREVWLYATAVQGYPERIRPARRQVALTVLERLGILGDGACRRVAALPAEGALPAGN